MQTRNVFFLPNSILSIYTQFTWQHSYSGKTISVIIYRAFPEMYKIQAESQSVAHQSQECIDACVDISHFDFQHSKL